MISQNFVVFSEYMNFNSQSHLLFRVEFLKTSDALCFFIVSIFGVYFIMVFGFDTSLQWSIYYQTMWRESNWTEIVQNRGTIWQNISLQSSNVYKSIDYRVWCCWFQSGTTNGYYFLTIVHLVERYKIDFGIEWSKSVSYQLWTEFWLKFCSHCDSQFVSWISK